MASGLADKQYIYDDFGRIFQQVTKHNGQTVATDTFTYEAAGNTTSGRVASLQTAAGTYTYTYDANGNILSVTFGGNTTTYVYDSQNQLIREDNQAAGYTYQWTYDNAGNILSRKRYNYTTAEELDGNFEVTETLTYTYDANWGDLLTKINNLSITYDTIGNPINYYNGYSFTWENGRRLSTMAVGMSTWTMGYDNSGMRIRRTDGTTDYRYAYIGGKLTQMAVNNTVLDFTYDANGAPMTVTYNGMVYYYVTNLQGDVTAILNYFGVPVVAYTYDAWGNILSTTGSMANTLGQLNPLRYRGYVYDQETGFYYLQSRYYDPAIGRFINADALVSTGQGILGNNMFAYCGNNPINNVDSTGLFWKEIGDFFSSAWNRVATIAKNTFGAGSSVTKTVTEVEDSVIPDPFPITITNGSVTTKTIAEYGDSSKPISVYANEDADDPIFSSSAGVKINIGKFSLDFSWSLKNMGISASWTEGNTTNTFGTKINVVELKAGIECSTSVQWDNITQTTYTNSSTNGGSILAAYLLITTGQYAVSPYYAGQ